MWHGIYGHDRLVDRFRQSLAKGRLGSSYLFLGEAGIGKHTLALKLAQGLLCQGSAEDQLDPCGQCESCRLMEAGNHPDLDLVGLPAGKRWLPVDLFIGDRDHRHKVGLCHNIAMRPMLGRRRVAIIDDADHLTTESANSLLKTLEEPPPGAVLILIGTSRSRQLPTILSRTQVIRFSVLPTDVVADLLIQQEIAADQAQATALAQMAEGTLDRANELADPELWQFRERIAQQFAPQSFDSIRLGTELTALVSTAGKEPEARRRRLRSIFHLVGDHFRQVLHSSCSMMSESGEPQPLAGEQFDPTAQGSALAVLDRCLEAEEQLDRNANQATLLECWLDDLAEILTQSLAIR